ncbi:hypothetical protein RJ639_000050 [Escallonia herrerae]|uniref:NAC domain-containing protein n=1 Tax=Escallonia herrerae TaxID=1293975 RepID=A0AA88XAJ2_9ASTE|nr:hypothetical protein RJ639_000050 [Escallonia herrerae]
MGAGSLAVAATTQKVEGAVEIGSIILVMVVVVMVAVGRDGGFGDGYSVAKRLCWDSIYAEMMCPPSLVFPPADIGLWTEEELFKSLRKIIDGSPLPGNVITDVNPYQYKPSHLPEGIWYLIRSEGKKDSENGFWKVKGKACEIFTNSTITGWRTTFEFYEGQAPHGPRIDWLIQEYGITYKGVGNNSKPKDSKSLCRIFHSDQQGSDHELPSQYGEADTARKNQADSILASVPKADSSAGRGSLRQSPHSD